MSVIITRPHPTIYVAIALIVIILWPLGAPPKPEGSGKFVHLITFAALAFPLSLLGRLQLLAVLVGSSNFRGAIETI